MITRKKNGRSEAFRTVEPRIPAIFPLGILEVLPSRLRPAELQGLPRVHEGFQLPCSPPTVPPGPGEHVKLAEIREREPKGKTWKGCARLPHTNPCSHGSLGFRLHKLFLFDKASTISCSRGKRWWRMGRAPPLPPHATPSQS